MAGFNMRTFEQEPTASADSFQERFRPVPTSSLDPEIAMVSSSDIAFSEDSLTTAEPREPFATATATPVWVSAVPSSHSTGVPSTASHQTTIAQAKAASTGTSGTASGVFGWNQSVTVAFFVCLGLLTVTLFACFFFMINRRRRRNNSLITRGRAGSGTRRGSGLTSRTAASFNWRRATTETGFGRDIESPMDDEVIIGDGEKRGFKSAAVAALSNLKGKRDGKKNGSVDGTSPLTVSPTPSGDISLGPSPTPYSAPLPPLPLFSGPRDRGDVDNKPVVGFAARYGDNAVGGIRAVTPEPAFLAHEYDPAEAPEVPRHKSPKPAAQRNGSTKSRRSDSRRSVRSLARSRSQGNNGDPSQRPSTASSATSFLKNSTAPLTRSLSKTIRGPRSQRDVEAEIMEIEREVDLRSESRRSRSRNGMRPVTPNMAAYPGPVAPQGVEDGFCIVAKRHDSEGEIYGDGNTGSGGELIPVYQRKPTPMGLADFTVEAGAQNLASTSGGGGKLVWKRNHV